MYKKDNNWLLSKKGKEKFGGIQKDGQYGGFVIWPEEMITYIDDNFD